MQQKFVVLGWGSLLYDLGTLGTACDFDWHQGMGPRLPLEFSRISPKRNMALTVCLDRHAGTECLTHVLVSHRRNILQARDDLAMREQAPLGHIGHHCMETGQSHGREEFKRPIVDWCRMAGVRGAVWTDLPSNFQQVTGDPFSLERAIAYFSSLTDDSLLAAVDYMNRAPVTTMTPLRKALMDAPQWRDLVQEVEVRKLTGG